jgi:two-component system, NarL family, sensor kinase
MKILRTKGFRINWIFFFLVLGSSAQNGKVVDSLVKIVNNPGTADSTRIKLYGDISWELLNVDMNKALDYAKKELALAMETNRQQDIAQAESDLGNIFNRRAVYDSAIAHYFRAVKLRENLKQDEKVAGIYSNLSTVYMRQSKFKEALDINFKSLKIFEKSSTPENLSKQAVILGNVGNLYYELEQNEAAEAFFRKGITKAREAGAPTVEANILVNIGDIKFEYKDYDSALFYLKAAEKIMTEGNVVYGLGVVYNVIGKIYSMKNDYDKAIPYYEKAMKIRTEMGDFYGIGLSSLNIGDSYLIKGNFEKGIEYLNKSADIFKQLKNYVNLKQSYEKLAVAYEDKKDYLTSLKYHQLYAQLKDSVYSQENAQQMAEMKVRFDTEEKEIQNLRLSNENAEKDLMLARRNNIILIVASILGLVLVSAFFINQRNKLKQKQRLGAELLRQQELRNRAIIEAEEKERRRIARDLHDGIGQLLSAAKLNLSSLESGVKQNMASPEMIKNAIDLVDDSVREVRSVSHNMMPGALIKSGLATAVGDLVSKISDTRDLKVNLEIIDFTERLEETKEIVLYRVIQELLNNAIKHSGASEINLQIVKHETELSIMLEDNGKGFDTSILNSEKGMGLNNIISRISFLNGQVDFDSAPGKGTTVVIELPC